MNYTVSSHSFSSKSHELTNGQLTLSYDERNVLKTIMAGPVMLGQHETPEFEQAVSNVYLRVKSGEAISVTPLVFLALRQKRFVQMLVKSFGRRLTIFSVPVSSLPWLKTKVLPLSQQT